MALGDLAGRARARANNFEAMGECDRDGTWWPLSRLTRQFQWQGVGLADTGYLVCPRCLDTPFEQQKTILLPPDPLPRINPRPSHDVTPMALLGSSAPTSPDTQGFTQFVLGGSPLAPFLPTSKAAVLANIAVLTGLPVPSTITDESVVLAQGQAVTVLAPNPLRIFMALYNPTQQPCEFALGATAWNGSLNLSLGAGQCYVWSAAQNLQPLWQGAVSAIGQYGPLPLWAWDTTVNGLASDGGVLFISFPPSGYPSSPAGLSPGALYLVANILPNNEYAIGVVPGATPNPGAAPLYLAGTTDYALLAAGGGNLPTSLAGVTTGQLWNNTGLVCVGLSG